MSRIMHHSSTGHIVLVLACSLITADALGARKVLIARRFQSSVYFPLPDVEQRYRLWENTLNGRSGLDDGVDLTLLANEFELSGGAITNVVRYGAISALQMNRTRINRDDLVKGVTKELRKEGKTA